jgi:hypothetical protein
MRKIRLKQVRRCLLHQIDKVVLKMFKSSSFQIEILFLLRASSYSSRNKVLPQPYAMYRKLRLKIPMFYLLFMLNKSDLKTTRQ